VIDDRSNNNLTPSRGIPPLCSLFLNRVLPTSEFEDRFKPTTPPRSPGLIDGRFREDPSRSCPLGIDQPLRKTFGSNAKRGTWTLPSGRCIYRVVPWVPGPGVNVMKSSQRNGSRRPHLSQLCRVGSEFLQGHRCGLCVAGSDTTGQSERVSDL
jgi:hypothetical protein